MERLDYKVNPKEALYFSLKLLASAAIYLLIVFTLYSIFSQSNPAVSGITTAILLYAVMLIIAFIFLFGIRIGHIKGNGVKVTSQQFPQIDVIVENQYQKLGLARKPDVYILQSGGILNAFATRFVGTNYIVLFSELVDAALEEDPNVLEFVIAHELGHLKRNHGPKQLWTFPGNIIPFLAPAYSRACEYTCDNIGAALAPKGVKNGLQMLAAGPKLFKKVNTKEMIRHNYNRTGFWFWFAEKVSTHPHLCKRLEQQSEVTLSDTQTVAKRIEDYITADHSRYMPS